MKLHAQVQVEIEDRTKGTMKETEIKRLLSANVICIFSIIVATVIPSLFLENFSILGTHLTWLSICSASVGTVNIVLYFILKPNPSNRRTSLAHKVARFLRCCVYFFMSCILFHGIIVLYGAPLIEAMSIWDSSLQITAMCSVVGAWLGAFPIPLDWDRPWQVWPISCSLGATFGYVAGLLIAPLWIYWNRKQLTYKSR
ncbi:phosphatidylinositol-glycan biosynthesis class F protein isoform X3 [Zootoca vivipara]|uniref:phosphatidylinositol-glycan biosynthesis class F protein isoform X3 n=1 Tax=Zootoca vivipara TaxID=8524 RepID=UPI00293BA648|nr:phosphatidylinositol-glycan biosynthesis class F protein isoform X3 [Zootoca vivipara]